jgi:hypothetical protein
MYVAGLWLVYIVLVLILWALFSFSADRVTGLTSLFYAFVIGFLVIFILSPGINREHLSDEEKAWFNALLALTIILPFIVIGLMICYIYQDHYLKHSQKKLCC